MRIALLRAVSRYRCWTSAFNSWASTAPSATTGTRASSPKRTSDPTAPGPYFVVASSVTVRFQRATVLTSSAAPHDLETSLSARDLDRACACFRLWGVPAGICGAALAVNARQQPAGGHAVSRREAGALGPPEFRRLHRHL